MKRHLILFLSALVLSGCASKRHSEFTGSPAVSATGKAALSPATPASVPTVKEKSQIEMEEASHRLDGLRAYLRRSYPVLRLEKKNALWEVSVAYVAWLGLDVNSPRGARKLENVLSSLIAASPDSGSSQWLFQATLRASTGSTAPNETFVYGLATVTQTNDSVTIVSHPGKIKVNFHGLMSAGQLRGQLDFSADSVAFTSKAEGVMLPETISLKIGGAATGKPVQGTILLLR